MHCIAARPRPTNSCATCFSSSVMSLAILFDLPRRRSIVRHRNAYSHRLLARVLRPAGGRDGRPPGIHDPPIIGQDWREVLPVTVAERLTPELELYRTVMVAVTSGM